MRGCAFICGAYDKSCRRAGYMSCDATCTESIVQAPSQSYRAQHASGSGSPAGGGAHRRAAAGAAGCTSALEHEDERRDVERERDELVHDHERRGRAHPVAERQHSGGARARADVAPPAHTGGLAGASAHLSINIVNRVGLGLLLCWAGASCSASALQDTPRTHPYTLSLTAMAGNARFTASECGSVSSSVHSQPPK